VITGATAAEAADQLRNRSGLESALARPETYAHYQGADVALQAAVLAHGIAEGQQFIDGNKRTALIAMLTFLEINGWRVEAPDPDLANLITQLQRRGDTGERRGTRGLADTDHQLDSRARSRSIYREIQGRPTR
jgi:death-on-curing family protein